MGKLAKWLRIMGYDTMLFCGDNDSQMVTIALKEGRVIITRDTQIMKRRVVTSGWLKAVFIKGDEPEEQMHQLIAGLNLDCKYRPFALCLECNQPLVERSRGEVQDLVPPYVFQAHRQYMECPVCHRIYWRGTHWQAMTNKLNKFMKCSAR